MSVDSPAVAGVLVRGAMERWAGGGLGVAVFMGRLPTATQCNTTHYSVVIKNAITQITQYKCLSSI